MRKPSRDWGLAARLGGVPEAGKLVKKIAIALDPFWSMGYTTRALEERLRAIRPPGNRHEIGSQKHLTGYG